MRLSLLGQRRHVGALSKICLCISFLFSVSQINLALKSSKEVSSGRRGWRALSHRLGVEGSGRKGRLGGRRNGDGHLRIGGKREILGTATRTSVDLSWLGRARLFDEGRRREGSGDSETKHRNGGAGSRRSSPKDATDLLHRTENQACGPAGAWRTFHPLWLLNTLGRTPIFTFLPDSHRPAPHMTLHTVTAL